MLGMMQRELTAPEGFVDSGGDLDVILIVFSVPTSPAGAVMSVLSV
jgi:hypothetical protein